MRFYKELYMSEECLKNKRKIRHKIRFQKPMRDIYLVVLSSDPHDQLEIFNSNLLIQKSVDEDVLVVAVTKGYAKALEFVEETLIRVYNETGNADIKSYILNREQEL